MTHIRVRVETLGSQTCGIVRKSQSSSHGAQATPPSRINIKKSVSFGGDSPLTRMEVPSICRTGSKRRGISVAQLRFPCVATHCDWRRFPRASIDCVCGGGGPWYRVGELGRL
eukprot:COSAG01_NODE_32923_length_573_cov_0.848101_1_plen_112_part_10